MSDKMAFQSERALIKCASCSGEFKFFKTMESENPDWMRKPDREPTLEEYYASQNMALSCRGKSGWLQRLR